MVRIVGIGPEQRLRLLRARRPHAKAPQLLPMAGVVFPKDAAGCRRYEIVAAYLGLANETVTVRCTSTGSPWMSVGS
jgi:hypothetical protein